MKKRNRFIARALVSGAALVLSVSVQAQSYPDQLVNHLEKSIELMELLSHPRDDYTAGLFDAAGNARATPSGKAQADQCRADIAWNQSTNSFRVNDRFGERFSYCCPPRAGSAAGSIWGTLVYTTDSSICLAAAHSGVITEAAGGRVTFEVRRGQDSYEGSVRNGITSSRYGRWGASFTFVSGAATQTKEVDREIYVQLPPPAGQPRVTARKDVYAVGEAVAVEVFDLPAQRGDEWVTVVPADAAEGSYRQWQYTNKQKTGTFTFRGLSEPGEYEVRFHQSNGDRIVRARDRFRVGSTSTAARSEWTVNYGTLAVEGEAITVAPPGEGQTSYYIAPASFHGDWRGYAQLSFEKRSWGGDYYGPDEYGARGDVIVSSGPMSARYDIAPDHSTNWRQFTLPLSGAGWRLSGGARTLGDVLANVTDLRIRAEYGAGTDYSALRRVSLDRTLSAATPKVVDREIYVQVPGPGNGPRLDARKNAYAVGEDIVVDVFDLPAQRSDEWITITPKGAYGGAYKQWMKTGQVRNGTFTFRGLTAPGEYEVRFHQSSGDSIVRARDGFTVR